MYFVEFVAELAGLPLDVILSVEICPPRAFLVVPIVVSSLGTTQPVILHLLSIHFDCTDNIAV